MIDHIPDMIENGVDSLKIEGRMKSIHYVSTVSNCYKAAVDAYLFFCSLFYIVLYIYRHAFPYNFLCSFSLYFCIFLSVYFVFADSNLLSF